MLYKILAVSGVALEGKQKHSEAEKGTGSYLDAPYGTHSSVLLPQQQGQKSLPFTLYNY